ncbi:MAG: BatD family protein, partial [Acidobacteria bacterium]|nr:BatD family protein [Acidobacteriota bacterium]
MVASTESRLTIVNGQATGSVTYRFVLQPLEAGQLTIGPIRVTLDGRSHLTEPIHLEVAQGTGRGNQQWQPVQTGDTLGTDHQEHGHQAEHGDGDEAQDINGKCLQSRDK